MLAAGTGYQNEPQTDCQLGAASSFLHPIKFILISKIENML